MLVFRLALRALRWRSAASLTVFAIALVGVGAAAVGPIYLRAVDETVLTERLTQAPQAQRDLHIAVETVNGSKPVDWLRSVRSLAADGADPRWFDPPVYSEVAQVAFRHGVRYVSQLAALDGLCEHVTVVSGRCLAASGETLISARTASGLHLAVGDTIQVASAGEGAPFRLHIVGVVKPTDLHGSYWNAWHYFNAAPPPSDSDPPRLDSFFVTHRTLSERIAAVAQTLAANLRLRPAAVHVADLGALRAHVRAVVAAAGELPAPTPKVVSQLPGVLDGMHEEMSLARNLIILPTVQLVLLAMLVLYAVVAGTAAVQGPELALARLRGRRSRSVLLQGLAEPVMLVLLAAPAAAALAWLIVRLVADRLLGRHVDVVFPLPATLAVAAATAGAIGAAAIAARRILSVPVGALLRRGVDQRDSGVGVAVADAAAVVLALAGLLELLAGGVLQSGGTDPLSALAPTLLAVAAAVVALRLLPAAGSMFVRWTRDSPRLASFLAVRQIARRPAGARSLLLIAVAIALATFAVANWSVARTNREARALNEAGASTVLQVRPGPHVGDLRAAVDRADPGGHSMAAAVVNIGNSTPVLAVDAARFSGVAAWRSNYSATPLPAIVHALDPAEPQPVSVTGTRLRLDVDLLAAPAGAVGLTVYVTGTDHLQTAYDLGALRPGRSVYTTDLARACATGCRITGLAMAPVGSGAGASGTAAPPTTRATITAQVFRGGRWTAVPSFERAASWRADGEGDGTARARDGLILALQPESESAPWPRLVSADTPTHLPAVLASGTASSYPGSSATDLQLFGLDGRPQFLDGRLTAVVLPRLDRYGAMVDLGLALDAMTNRPSGSTRFQVWLAPGAPADMAARLAREGVTVTGRQQASTYRAALDHSGPAYADGLFLIAAAAATLLAVGTALLGGGITARRRGYEFAALAAVGVARRTLRRATAMEHGALVGVGVLVGVAAGIGGSALALPSTPFFVDEGVGPPVQHALPYGLLAVCIGAVVAVFLVTSLVIGRLVARQAAPARLREAQQ